MYRPQALALLAFFAALLLAPSSSLAAVATADTRIKGGLLVGSASFKAAPGERNELVISWDEAGRVLFRDRVRVYARGDCEQVDKHAAACPQGEFDVQAFLGDRADRARVKALTHVFGGRGNDVLRGETHYDVLFGGTGHDRLTGGHGMDQLTGGPGRDHLLGGGGDDQLVDGETDRQAARDVFDGGASRDTAGADGGDSISYSERKRNIRTDLRRRPAAYTSTEDVLRGLESVQGGSGDDRLSGDGDDNFLSGGPGNDLLRGRGGRDIPSGGDGDDRVEGGRQGDVVWGDAGNDRLYGGAGDDLLISGEEEGTNGFDHVVCGAGEDAARSEHHDTLTASCERVATYRVAVTVRPSVDAETARFEVTCLAGTPVPCPGKITLFGADDGKRYGGARFDVPEGRTQTVVVKLTPIGAKELAAGAMVRVELSTDEPMDREAGFRTFMRRG